MSGEADVEGSNLSRLTVNLTPLGRSALEHAARATGNNRTDVINEALAVFARMLRGDVVIGYDTATGIVIAMQWPEWVKR